MQSLLSEVKSKTQSLRKVEIIEVDLLVAGGGPAALGMLCNAAKTNRLKNLLTQGNGIAILETGYTLGGGNLQHYIINSNTSADGFIQCLYGDAKNQPSKRSKSTVAAPAASSMAAESKKATGDETDKKRSSSEERRRAAEGDMGDKNY